MSKTVTVKGYYDLFERLFQQEERVRSFQLGDVFDKDEGDVDYTAVILQPIDIRPILQNSQVVMNEYRVTLFCLGLRLKDKSNTQDVLSETANILTDSITRLLQSSEYYNLQIQIIENNIQLEHLYVKGNDLALGHAMTFSFQAPYLLDGCDFDFDALSSSSAECAAALISNSDGSYSVSVASGGSLILSDVTVNNQDGQTETFPFSGDVYSNFTGASVTTNVFNSNSVFFTSASTIGGGTYNYTIPNLTISNLVTTESFNIPYSGTVGMSFSGLNVTCRVTNSVFSVLSNETVAAGAIGSYQVADSTFRTYSDLAQTYIVSSSTAPAETNANHHIPPFSISTTDGQRIDNVSYSASVWTTFTAATAYAEVQDSLLNVLTGYTIDGYTTGTSVISDSVIQNSDGSFSVSIPATSGHTLLDIDILDGDANVFATYPAASAYTIPDITVMNSDGQSATSVNYSATVHTTFSAGISASGIAYQRVYPSSFGTSYSSGDTHFNTQNGVFTYTAETYPATIAQVDYTATEADIRGVYYGTIGDGTDLIAPTYLVDNNAFGNKYRFTDDIGNPSDYSSSDFWDHVNFNNHAFTGGATSDYIIDHVTGLGYYTQHITDGTKYNMDVTVSADGQTWEEWNNFLFTGCTEAGFSDWRLLSPEEAQSGMHFFRHLNGQGWAREMTENIRRYTVLATSFSSTQSYVLWDSNNSAYFIGNSTKAGSSGFLHRISYFFAVRTHF